MKTPLRVLGAMLVAVLVAVVGCSQPNAGSPAVASPAGSPAVASPAGSPAVASPGPSTYTAQFINPLPNIPVWRKIGDCMASKFKDLGVDFTESGSSGDGLDATQMVTQLQQAIATGKDAVITLPVGDAFAPVLLQAQKQGIVTGVSYGAGGEGSGVDFVVGADWSQLGTLYGETIAARPGKQYVGLVASDDTGIGKQWMDAIKKVASSNDNLKVVGEVFTNDDSSKTLDQVNALLTASPEINVIATYMGTATQGAVAAITNKDLIGKVVLVGNGTDGGGQQALDSGIAYKMLLTPFCRAGELLAQTTFDWLNGDKSKTFVPNPSQLFGPDEIKPKVAEGWF